MPLIALLSRLLALVVLVGGFALSIVAAVADGFGPFAVGVIVLVTLSMSVGLSALGRICADTARIARYVRVEEKKRKTAAEAEDPVLAYFS